MYKSELFQNPQTPSYSITTIPSQLMPQSSTVASKDVQVKETTLEEFTTGEEKIGLINTMASQYTEISGNAVEYETSRDTLNSHNKYDFSGNYLHYRDGKPTVKDALQEDIEIAVTQRNNSYIVGMITVATVVITTYLVLKRK